MLLSIVVPVFNETLALPKLLSELERVMQVSGLKHELVLVDDGSTDGTAELLKQAASRDSRLKVLFFSRNFGHQAAITAGLDHAAGDMVAVIDADLQDPPDLLPEMVKLMQQGYDVVSAQRIARDGETAFKRITARVFYWMMRRLVDQRFQEEVGDFRLFSRRAIMAIRQLREQHRFMRGMVSWLGLKEATLPYHRNSRVAGETKYSFWKMLRFAWTAVSSFSALPLRMSVVLGLFVTVAGIIYAIYSLFAAFVLHATVSGWTSLVCLNIIFSGTTLVAVGLVGEYVARIYEEAKGRPIYVIDNSANLRAPGSAAARSVFLPEDRIVEEPRERAATKSHRV